MMFKKFLLLALILAVLPFASAIPFIDLANIDATGEILQEEFQHISDAPDPNDVAIIVVGGDLSGVEDILMKYVSQQYPFFEQIDQVSDTEISLNQVLSTNKTVILLGGPSQNFITRELDTELQEKDHPSKDFVYIYESVNDANAEMLVISDGRGFNNIGRPGPSRSPLAKFMSPPAVVATASLFSILLSTIWFYLSGPVRVVLAKVVTGFRKRTLDVKAQTKGFSIGNVRIKYREMISIFFGAVAYATGVTFAVTGLGIPVVDALQINLVGGLIFYFVRELARLIMSAKMDLHTEFVFWFPGALFSLFTGWLGNTLNTPGFVVEHTDKEVKFAKYSFVKYVIVAGTFVVSIILLVANILFPSVKLQLFGIIASTYAAIETIPLRPCPGADFIKWKPVLWGFTLIVVFASYIFFNFFI